MRKTPSRDDLPGAEEIDRAVERLRGRIHRTPLMTSRTLGDMAACEVHLKCENLQRAGSFKIRGALNACARAAEENEVTGAGFLTYSSGNHGQAVALAARVLGSTATVVVPEDIPAVKQAAIKGYGATIVRCGLTSQDRHTEALRIARDTGARIIEPFDHPDTMAGQATVAVEILDDLPDVDVVLVPVGGGGLIGGIALAAALREPRPRVVGVEPEDANGLARSLAAGKRVTLDAPPRTIADGLRPLAPGELPFLAASEHVERVLCVGDEPLRRAQRLLLERAKLFVEPSGAATTAALLEHRDQFRGLKVAVVLSGGNAEVPRF